MMDPKLYLINVGPGGTFKPSGSLSTTVEDVDNIFEYLKKNNKNKITIYFHGGLVSENAGLETAKKISKHIKDSENHPICFIWETGFLETVGTNIKSISSLRLFEIFKKIIIKRLSERLGIDPRGKGLSRGLSFEEIDEELQTRSPFEELDLQSIIGAKGGEFDLNSKKVNERNLKDELEEEINTDIETTPYLADEVQREVSISNEKGINSKGIISTAGFVKSAAAIAFKVIKRLVTKRDHGFYPTIVEEILREVFVAQIGAWIWEGMKEKARVMWNENSGRTGVNLHAGTYFLERLNEYYNHDKTIQINVIGHSAGSIVTCHMVSIVAQRFPMLKFRSVLFLAPAVRVETFVESIIANPQVFECFRMFTMQDELEKKDHLVPYLYTRSLLYLISGVLEDKGDGTDCYILGLERHVRNQEPYNRIPELKIVHEFLHNQIPERVVYSLSEEEAMTGFRCRSTSHGGFDEEVEFTVDSLKTIISSN